MILRLRSSGVESVESDDATVVLDDQAEVYFSTNPAGSLLWKQLKRGTTREELVSTLTEAFDGLDRSEAETDVDAFIRQLEAFGLLEGRSD